MLPNLEPLSGPVHATDGREKCGALVPTVACAANCAPDMLRPASAWAHTASPDTAAHNKSARMSVPPIAGERPRPCRTRESNARQRGGGVHTARIGRPVQETTHVPFNCRHAGSQLRVLG